MQALTVASGAAPVGLLAAALPGAAVAALSQLGGLGRALGTSRPRLSRPKSDLAAAGPACAPSR